MVSDATPTSKDQTLLPCPFCGLRPNLIRAFNDPAWWIISCPHADCEVGPTIEREGQDAAIAAWNKRGTVETTDCHVRPHSLCSAGTCNVCREAARYRWIRDHAEHSVTFRYKGDDGNDRETSWAQIPRALDEQVDRQLELGQKASAQVRAGRSVKDPTPPQKIVLCAAPGPSGFICERPEGHPGRHCDGDNTKWDSGLNGDCKAP